MKTAQNRAKVLAQYLRAARKDVLDAVEFMNPEKVERFGNAVESIDAVAEELEAIADERLMCSASLGRKGRCPNAAVKVYGYNRLGVKGELPRCERHPLGNATFVRAVVTAPDPAEGGR